MLVFSTTEWASLEEAFALAKVALGTSKHALQAKLDRPLHQYMIELRSFRHDAGPAGTGLSFFVLKSETRPNRVRLTEGEVCGKRRLPVGVSQYRSPCSNSTSMSDRGTANI